MLICLQALAYKNTSSLQRSKSQTNQVAPPPNSCHWLSLNFALFISSHMNFDNFVCQLHQHQHQHHRYPNLFVLGPAYEVSGQVFPLVTLFLASQLTHKWLNLRLQIASPTTASFHSSHLGVLCSPVILTSCSLTVRWCGMQPVPKTTRNPHQVRGLVLQWPRGHLPSGASDPHRRHEEAPQEKKAKLQEAHCCTRGLQGTAAELQDSPRQASLNNNTPVWSPTTLWATGECRWYGWMWFLVLKHLHLQHPCV